MAYCEYLEDRVRTVCQIDRGVAATLAHRPVCPGRDEQRRLVQRAHVIPDGSLSFIEAFAGYRSLPPAILALARRMCSGCEMNPRKKRSHSAQLLRTGLTAWLPSPYVTLVRMGVGVLFPSPIPGRSSRTPGDLLRVRRTPGDCAGFSLVRQGLRYA